MFNKKKIICIIPAKLNSKRIKKKNILKVGNFKLIEYTLAAVKKSKYIDSCYISSESTMLKNICDKYNFFFVKRPINLTTKRSSSELTLLHTIKKTLDENYDICIFLQPTSPLRFKDDIDKSIELFFKKKLDSLFSSSFFKGHIWLNSKNKLKAINYNFKNRKMDQDKNDQLIENGSIYIFKIKPFLNNKNRLFGKIGTFIMDDERSHQIDETHDINIIESILNKSRNRNKFVRP